MNLVGSLTVIALVGPSGAGKSTAIKTLAAKYCILEEKYMELNLHKLDNRLMLSKWNYIQYWFDSVLQAKKDGIELLITDRCPLDTCAYVSNGGSKLFEIIETSFKELAKLSIYVKTVLVTADFNILQDRIDIRLVHDERRIAYNETDIDHNKRAYNFFNENTSLWDRIVDTSDLPKSDVSKLLDNNISEISVSNR